MSEENITPENEAPKEKGSFEELKELVDKVCADGPKGLEGNKQAARRSRSALNAIKKLCTPLRIQIQEAIKSDKKD